MSLFTLEAKDLKRSPVLITFDWHNGFRNYYAVWRNWRNILLISKPNLWVALFVNILVVGALDAAAVALAVNVSVIDEPILIFLGFALLMTVLYLPNMIKLFNFLRGKGYSG